MAWLHWHRIAALWACLAPTRLSGCHYVPAVPEVCICFNNSAPNYEMATFTNITFFPEPYRGTGYNVLDDGIKIETPFSPAAMTTSTSMNWIQVRVPRQCGVTMFLSHWLCASVAMNRARVMTATRFSCMCVDMTMGPCSLYMFISAVA